MTSLGAVLHRLYLSLLSLACVAATVVGVGYAVIEVHDRRVSREDFACYDKAKASVWSSPPTAEEIRAASAVRDELKRDQPPERSHKGIRVTDPALIAELERSAWLSRAVDVEAAARCNLNSGATRSTRAWGDRHQGRRERELDDVDLAVAGVVLFPLALFGIRRWTRWILSPAE